MAHQADATRMLDDRGYTGTLIRGQNPLLLFEKAVRDRIVDSYYWKEQCFGLNAATLCDRAVDLTFIGGTYGIGQKPTPFLCLAFKLLQITPEKEIILHYLQQEDWKYLRALAAFYIRLTWEPKDIYETLEAYLSDYRKLKRRTRDAYTLSYIDQFIDDLLTKDRVCATSLWKMPSRTQLEDLDVLEPRVSPLGDEIDELDAEDEDMKDGGDGEIEEVRNDQGAEAMIAEAEVEVMKGEEAGAEATIATTDEAGVVAMKEEEVTAASTTTGGEVTAVSYQTEGEARYRDPGHAREVEQLVEMPSISGRKLLIP
ncbi:PRP38-domain-containing protein [Aureobasidium sp. EXF-3400]|nr:PRP38-domain-containing protein [Aureobasidium sp. EXF-3400]